MNNEETPGIETTWGREFCTVIDGLVETACGQDAYEVYSDVLGGDVRVSALRAASEQDLIRMRDAARALFETEAIEVAHIREAVEATIRHWNDH